MSSPLEERRSVDVEHWTYPEMCGQVIRGGVYLTLPFNLRPTSRSIREEPRPQAGVSSKEKACANSVRARTSGIAKQFTALP
jgi:hypothetical protein